MLVNKILKIFAYSCILFLVSCAGLEPLSPADKNQVHTIAVNQDVLYPDTISYSGPYFHDPSEKFKFFFGPMNQLDEPIILAAVKKNNIRIDQIVRDEFITAINQQPGLHVVDANADATLRVIVHSYGFQAPGNLGDYLAAGVKPLLDVRADLIRHGQVIWHGRDYVTPMHTESKVYPILELMAKPELMAAAWRAPAKEIAQNFSKQL